MENQKQNQNALQLLRDELPTLQALIGLNARKGTDVRAIALQELEYLSVAALTKPELLTCEPVSIIAAVKSVLKKNLTLDPDAGLVYIKTRAIALERDGNNKVTKWGKILEIQDTANGLISIARQCGRILDYKRPEVFKNEQGRVVKVRFEILLPSYGDPRWESREFDESDFNRWQIASHKENSRNKQDADIKNMNYANPNYTSWKGGIDPEFARAKAIRHGLKKLGTNPNEAKMDRIAFDQRKEVIVDPVKDAEAANEEAVYADVVDSNPLSSDGNNGVIDISKISL